MSPLLSSALSRHGRNLRVHVIPAPVLDYRASSSIVRSRHDGDDDDDREGDAGKSSRLPHARRIIDGGIIPSRIPITTKSGSAPRSSQRRPTRCRAYATAIARTATAATTTRTTTTMTARHYHATPRSDILPFVAIGVFGLGAMYAYKAFDQMDRDMEEYERKLDEYEEEMMRVDPTFKSTRSRGRGRSVDDFAGGTLAIDVGTTRMKLSYLSSFPGEGTTPPVPTVCVDREGHRSTPSIVWLPPAGGDEMPLFGRHAEARAYDTRGGIALRPREMCDIDDDGRVTTDAFRHAVRDVAANALDQVLGGSGGGVVGDARTPLFVRSADRSTPGSYDVRPVFLHPPSMDGTTGTRRPGDEARYRDILAGLSYPEDIAVHVSEPVAIVAGAEHYGLLPPSSAGTTSVLVIDVGGTSTCVSLVADDEGGVKYSSTLPLGGETPIDLLVRRLAEDFYGPSSLGGGEDDGGDIDDSMANVFTTRPKLDDPAALQRLHEASVAAIRELSNKTRTEINLPYLTMNMTTRQPRHLRTDISRNVVDAAMENWVGSVLVPRLLRQQALDDGGSVLSRALPPPADLSTLFASIIARCLENTSQTPLALRAVLLVGGGARMPLVRDSMRGCVGYLAGDTYASKRLIMPEGEMGDELAALGGAVWGSRRGS